MPEMNTKLAVYIGDAVYVTPSDWEKGGMWLFTHDGISILDKIYLEPSVWESLKKTIEAWSKEP